MKRRYCIGLLCLLSICSVYATALDSFLQSLEKKTFQANFVLTISEEVNQPMNYPGEIKMRGECFRLTMFDMEAAYDGKSMAVYSSASDEITLSTPTAQELIETNPFLYARELVKVCDVKEEVNVQKQTTTITMLPKDKSAGIDKFVLVLKNGLPISITMKEGKQQTALSLQNAQWTEETISYELNYPSAYVNDLR